MKWKEKHPAERILFMLIGAFVGLPLSLVAYIIGILWSFIVSGFKDGMKMIKIFNHENET
jgi:hypothetical protein